jgi:RNA ligase
VTTAITTPTIRDLFNPGSLQAAVADGYVRRQVHPTEPLAILNYTEKAAYENVWDRVTLTCRGLIYNTETLRVAARPFAKFFNYGQAGSSVILLDAPVHVTDKLDGSLGILYPLPSGGWAVATRGSFTSDQAQHATELYQREYAPVFKPRPEQTVLFEIVYPTNRIVVDYGDTDDLLLLGAVETATGTVLDPTWVSDWPGPVVRTFSAPTLADALALEPRPNAEGVVVRCLLSGGMVKIKQADYVALHRIVTGLTARTVWEHMVAGKPLDELIAPLPDEFHQWVRDVAAGITKSIEREAWRLEGEYTAIRDAMSGTWQRETREGRAEFAKVAAKHPDSWAMFALLDQKDIRPKLLHNAKPEPYVTPSGRTFSEDNA